MREVLLRHGRLLAVIAVLALLVAAADRSRAVWDLSADRRFTVSEALARLLAAQTEAVAITGIWAGDDDASYATTAEALKRMAVVNPRVTWTRIDTVLDKPALASFAERFREADAPAVYLTRGERAFKIPLPRTVDGRFRATLQQEVGGALVALADPRPPVLAVVQGHGELRPGGGDEHGADRLLRAWQLAGFTVALRDLGRDRVRADEVLVLLGPTAALGATDAAAIARHGDDGGAILVLADDRAPAELITLLRRRGLVLGGMTRPFAEALARDPATALAATTGYEPVILASRRHFAVGQDASHPEPNLVCDDPLINPEHAIVRTVAGSGQAVLSPWSTPVHILEPAGISDQAMARRLAEAFARLGTPPFSGSALLRTADQDAWPKARAAELVIPADLTRLPALPLAWAVESQADAASAQAGRGARLVLWGSRQAGSDGVLGQERWANARLLAGAAAWLANRQAATGIPEAQTAQFRVDCDDGTLTWITALLAAILPCTCIGIAILWWWERR